MAASWTLALCDQQGRELHELTDALTVRYAALRNRAAEMTLGLDLDDAAALSVVQTLANGLPRLKAWRNNSLRFYGWWAPTRLTATADGGTMNLAFRDPFGRYETRYLPGNVFTAIDAGQIAATMIEDMETADAAIPVPRHGLDVGTIAATVARDRTYERGKFIGEAIRQLTEVQGGFDFLVTPRDDLGDDVLGVFDVYASLGSDRTQTVAFEYGPETVDNVISVDQQLGSPANYVEAFGDEGRYETSTDAPSAAKYGYFSLPIAASDGTVTDATLQSLADSELRPDVVSVVGFAPDPDTAPQPWDDYSLGDTVGLYADRGALQLDATPRVNGIEIVLDESGNESAHNLTIEEAA